VFWDAKFFALPDAGYDSHYTIGIENQIKKPFVYAKRNVDHLQAVTEREDWSKLQCASEVNALIRYITSFMTHDSHCNTHGCRNTICSNR
jgi:hypothetical protein